MSGQTHFRIALFLITLISAHSDREVLNGQDFKVALSLLVSALFLVDFQFVSQCRIASKDGMVVRSLIHVRLSSYRVLCMGVMVNGVLRSCIGN